MQLVSLVNMSVNESGYIRKIDDMQLPQKSRNSTLEMETRLLEMGFIEGAKIKVMHKGLWRNPIAVRINNSNSKIVLRKNEALAILLEKIG